MQIKNLKVATLPDMLRSAADRQPEKGFAFEENDGVTFLTYPQILREAKAWAARWQTLGLQPGDCVLVIMATAPLFAPVYWSLILCGAIPCVLPSPTLIQGNALGVEKLRQVGLRLKARWLVTSEHEIDIWGENAFPFPIKSIEEVASLSPASFTPPDINPEDIALIQASSGSTSQPKCIALTHLNVLANLYQSEDRLQASPNDVTVSWLPLFHDMGLIGCFLFVTYCQMKGVLIPPANFIRRPVRWLQAFTDHKGSLSPAPNFAYALALRRVSAAEQASLDLSSWRSAMCGAEPIDARVLQAFAKRFQPSGFDPTALTPCYGLAEAALCVTMKEMKRPLAVETICRETAATEQIAKVVPSNPNGQETLATLDVCDCGPPVVETIIEIRDEQGRVRQSGEIGRVWISSPSLMREYVGEPEKTAVTLQHGWLDTGDVGYLRKGHLFIVGRLKETIIIRGQNYYPTEFEQAAAELPQVELGKVVALGIYNEREGSEQLHLVIEMRQKGDFEGVQTAVQQHVTERTGIMPACVTLVPRHTITRTTSGKLQRYRLKMNYEQLVQQTQYS